MGPVTEAKEPTSYDRRFYARALIAGLILILVTVGIAVYAFAFKTEPAPVGPVLDLSSLFISASRQTPDLQNPCIVLQEHLEAIRTDQFRVAYSYLSDSVRKNLTLAEFSANARKSGPLFTDAEAYDVSNYRADEVGASAGGFIIYRAGGRSGVGAYFLREQGAWKITQTNIVVE